MEPIEGNAVEDFYGDQLVVDLPYLQLVLKRLDVELTPGPDKSQPNRQNQRDDIPGLQESEDLGLALLTLRTDSLKARVDALRAEPGFLESFLEAQPAALKNTRSAAEIPDLELVLFDVRSKFARDHAGWIPDMDKNHVASSIEGTPGISGGGEGAPEPADAADVEAFQDAIVHHSLSLADEADVTIGLLDTPIHEGHQLFKNVLTRLGDRLALDSEPIPQSAGHCTFVAGLIMARAPKATLIVRAVLSPEEAHASLWRTAQELVELARMRVHLINLSLVYHSLTPAAPSLALTRAIERARELNPGVVLIAAAGNHGHPTTGDQPPPPLERAGRTPLLANRPVLPAATPGVFAVGAFKKDTDPAKPELWDSSPHSAPWISFGAPGEDVVSTFVKGLVRTRTLDEQGNVQEQDVQFDTGLARWSGTSFATGTVTGEIARLMVQEGLNAQAAVRRLARGIPDCVVQPYPR
jgi:subtilisin family serine protease